MALNIFMFMAAFAIFGLAMYFYGGREREKEIKENMRRILTSEMSRKDAPIGAMGERGELAKLLDIADFYGEVVKIEASRVLVKDEKGECQWIPKSYVYHNSHISRKGEKTDE